MTPADRWNPATYLRFADQRLRPAVDLLARIEIEAPARAVDLGCGTGNATRLLAERWPGAKTLAIDSSPAMLAEAKRAASGRGIEWIEADIACWTPTDAIDLIFSNAALHWLDDHATLFPRLLGYLRPGGVLAIQIPQNFDQPSHTEIAAVVDEGPWRDRLRPLLRHGTVAAPESYAALLSPVTSTLDIWETVYYHRLEGVDPVPNWVRGTVLEPLLSALSETERAPFLGDYGARMRRAYPPSRDGTTLFPFRRIFIVATRRAAI